MDGLADLLALGPWAWIVLGLVLMALEIVVPGTFLLWFGLAALATGALTFVVSMPWAGQIVVFAVLAAVAAYEARRRLAREEDSEDPTLNTGAQRLVGNHYMLDEPIVGGRGRLRIGDGSWAVDGPDLPAGTSVEIVAVEGTRLRVAPV